MSTTTIPLSGYQIVVGPLAESLGPWLQRQTKRQLIVLVDQNTEQHCWPRLTALPDLPPLHKVVIPAGEVHKTLETCSHIWQALLDLGADRQALLLNLGGGVIGDMGGFCARTFKRGIDFVQVPTTLLAQVDASIGGKLGIDFGQVKNSIGLFGDPAAVFIDPALLSTLPLREIRSGSAEIIKHALIADRQQWLGLLAKPEPAADGWTAVIEASLAIKKAVVEADPWERGERKALNFGHTIGHAIESLALATPSPLLHGEAIAMGMIAEAQLAVAKGLLREEEAASICTFLIARFPPYPIDLTRDGQLLLDLMANDKKNQDGAIQFALIGPIGTAHINQEASPQEIIAALAQYNQLVS